MFSIDIPLIFANDAPLILAQKNNSVDNVGGRGSIIEVTKSTRKKTTIFTFCRDMYNHPIGEPQNEKEVESISATNFFSPSTSDVIQLLGAKKDDLIEVAILEKPKHGNLYPMLVIRQVWGYLSEDNYVGQDRVVFSVAHKDKKIIVIVNLLVTENTGEEFQYCADEKFKPVGQYEQLLIWESNSLFDLPNFWQTRLSFNRLVAKQH